MNPSTSDFIIMIVASIAISVAAQLLMTYYNRRRTPKQDVVAFISGGNTIFTLMLRYYHVILRVTIASVGISILLGGVKLLSASWTGANFLGAFLLVSGAQIALWAIGIRSEILGNVPATVGWPIGSSGEEYSEDDEPEENKVERNELLRFVYPSEEQARSILRQSVSQLLIIDREIDDSVRKLAEMNGLAAESESTPILQLVVLLRGREIIDVKTYQLLLDFWHFRSNATHGLNLLQNPKLAEEYVKFGTSLLKLFPTKKIR